jgi:phage shock protein E
MIARLLLLLALGFPTWATATDESVLIAAQALAQRQASGDAPALILDTRTPEEFAAGRVPGARLVPHDAVAAALDELAPYRHQEIVLYCRSGRRSRLAEAELRAHGFTRLTQLDGSWLAWEAASLPVEAGPAQAKEPTQ